jgi:hypothetical protein
LSLANPQHASRFEYHLPLRYFQGKDADAKTTSFDGLDLYEAQATDCSLHRLRDISWIQCAKDYPLASSVKCWSPRKPSRRSHYFIVRGLLLGNNVASRRQYAQSEPWVPVQFRSYALDIQCNYQPRAAISICHLPRLHAMSSKFTTPSFIRTLLLIRCLLNS